MRSSSFCSFRNSGDALRMMNKARISTAATAQSKTKPNCTSRLKVRMTASTMITGTGRTIWMKLVSAI